MGNIITDYDKMVILRDIVKEWSRGDVLSREAVDRVRSMVCPRPKPTAEDIAWAEKRLEELEEKDNG